MNITIHGVEITLTPEQLQIIHNAAQELNEPKKPSKEDRFWGLISGLTLKVDFKTFPKTIFLFKEDECWVEYDSKSGYLLLRYSRIWKVFEDEYGLNYNEIQSFIKTVVEEHFRRKGITLREAHTFNDQQVEEHFRRKGITPIRCYSQCTNEVEEHFRRKGITR